MTRIAYLSPLPPERTGIADYSATLLPELAKRVDVLAVAPGRPEPIPGVAICRPSRRTMRLVSRCDAVVAQVGNSRAHAWILEAIREVPSTIVLHEIVLHHLVAEMTIGRGDSAAYVDEMTRERGLVGRLLALGVVDGVVPPLWDIAPDRYALAGAALRHASQVLVHSDFLARAVRERRPELRTTTVPFPCPQTDRPEPIKPQGRPLPVVGVFGFVTRQKRLPVVLRALATARRHLPELRLLCVGATPPDIDLRRLTSDAGLPSDAVEIVGFSDPDCFERLLASVDIGVNLRHPTLGETSAVVVRWLGLGVPVVVSTGGWYDELPDGAVLG